MLVVRYTSQTRWCITRYCMPGPLLTLVIMTSRGSDISETTKDWSLVQDRGNQLQSFSIPATSQEAISNFSNTALITKSYVHIGQSQPTLITT